jgi:N-carbamoyl-L-amino-acid hydrolase
MIRAEDLRARLAGIEPIGRGPRGTSRLAWTPEDAAAARWFAAQAGEAGLAVERDPAGNLWAVPASPPPWWAVGSHLDSVRDGGRLDGALGVAAGFEIAARAGVPLAVISFADEEGARFNTPTFGSRALTGALNVDDALARTDDTGTTMHDAMARAGVDPGGLATAPRHLARLRGFIELHIDQSLDVLHTGRPIGIVSRLASRLRLRVDLHGRADHAGATRPPERRDALGAAARLVVHALDRAGGSGELVATASRILVSPNALTTIPSEVSVWLDARSLEAPLIAAWQEDLRAEATRLAESTGVATEIAVASQSPGVGFDADLRRRLAAAGAALGHPPQEIACFAGHDAGVLAAHLPAAMVMTRNPTGISHSPHEDVDLADAAVGAEAILRALEELAR